MQDRYTGDIGDYVKYALLRTLGQGRKLGVAWYLFPDEAHNSDGRHIDYLNKYDEWHSKDPELFQTLRRIMEKQLRTTRAIEESGVLGNTIFTGSLSGGYGLSPIERRLWREKWFRAVENHLHECNLVFADPDNGLRLDEKFSAGRIKDWKSIPVSEALALANGKSAIIYHHNTRRKGGHDEEIKYWLKQLGADARALRYRAYSARTFFIINPTQDMQTKLEEFSQVWGNKAQLY